MGTGGHHPAARLLARRTTRRTMGRGAVAPGPVRLRAEEKFDFNVTPYVGAGKVVKELPSVVGGLSGRAQRTPPPGLLRMPSADRRPTT